MVQLHLKEPSALKEACSTFVELADSTYANKSLGASGQLEVMACDCGHHASSDDEEMCGADANCINRMTYMECYGDFSGCDAEKCRNRRFQNHEHAKIDVFNAGLKGFGVRAREDIEKGGFIYEYTGEVLDEQRFQKKQQKYEREGLKHFYFMMLQKDEFIDATEKGSLARFCNHSCDPNAAIEKWVVGPKIRMGLFAKRNILKGEEICFDYKVDRYGSKAQPCYCESENCSGFLGGRTQTGGTLLPPSVVEGLGLDSEIALGWHEKSLLNLSQKFKLSEEELVKDLDSVLQIRSSQKSKRSKETLDCEESPGKEQSPKANGKQSTRKRRPKPEDLLVLLDAPWSLLNDQQKLAQQFLIEEFPINELDPEELPEFMRILMQAQDFSWLIDLMLKRVIHTSESKIQSQVMNMHGYEIMGTVLNRWKTYDSVVLSALEVLRQWPKVTKNKISSSQIEKVVSDIKETNDNSMICERAASLLEEWSGLSMGYRIPRKKLSEVPNSVASASLEEKKESDGLSTFNESKTNSLSASGPDSNTAKRLRSSLPAGWVVRTSSDGRTYYLNEKEKITSWKPPRDPRDIERETKMLKKEQENEKLRLQALQKDREKQANEIQRIISEAEALEALPASSANSQAHSISNSNSAGDITNESKESPKKAARNPSSDSLIRSVFAAYIPKLVFKYEQELGRERCKRHARDIVHALVKKEEAKNKSNENYELTDEQKNKLKAFVKQYMVKLKSRHVKAEPVSEHSHSQAPAST